MFLKLSLAILILVYAFWGKFQGKYVFPSRTFNNPNIVDDNTRLYFIFFALLSFVAFMVFSSIKNAVKNEYMKFFDITGTVFLLISIGLFLYGF